jgi:uncharacterized phiE125 gp8 family phage protein
MALTLITPPAVEPLTLAEAKAHLRVDTTDDDDLISALLTASRSFCEEWTGRAFVTQTWELVLDDFPTDLNADEIEIPRPPLRSVTSIKYDDETGLEHTLATDQYEVDDISQPGWVVPVDAGWPVALWEGINAVRIRFVAGYAPGANSPDTFADNIPGAIKAAIRLYLGQLYDQREDIVVGTIVNRVPSGSVQSLLRNFRVRLGMA